jgi:hypothetical protein
MTGQQHQGICLRASITLPGKELVPRSSFCGLHPSCGTIACSQALGSHNFCLQTAVFCIVSFHLQHQRILVASYLTPSSHLNINFTTGWMPVNSGFMAFLSMQSRGNLCTCPVHCSLLNFMQVKIFIFSISYSLYLILHIPFCLTDPNICLEDFPFKKVWKVFCFFFFSPRCHSYTWVPCQSKSCIILF